MMDLSQFLLRPMKLAQGVGQIGWGGNLGFIALDSLLIHRTRGGASKTRTLQNRVVSITRQADASIVTASVIIPPK